jgi:hypothetical protein
VGEIEIRPRAIEGRYAHHLPRHHFCYLCEDLAFVQQTIHLRLGLLPRLQPTPACLRAFHQQAVAHNNNTNQAESVLREARQDVSWSNRCLRAFRQQEVTHNNKPLKHSRHSDRSVQNQIRCQLEQPLVNNCHGKHSCCCCRAKARCTSMVLITGDIPNASLDDECVGGA